jgi:hypothetical protein
MIISAHLIMFLTLFFYFFIFLYERRRFIFPSPGFISSIVLFVYIVFSSYLYILFPDLSIDKRNYYGYSNDIYLTTLLIGFISIITFYLGFILIFRIKMNTFFFIQLFDDIFSTYKVKHILFASVIMVVIFFMVHYIKQNLGFIHYAGELAVNERGVGTIDILLTKMSAISMIYFPLMLYIVNKYSLTIFMKYFITFVLILEIFRSMVGGAAGLVSMALTFMIFYQYTSNKLYFFTITRLFKYIFYSIVILLFAFSIKLISRSFDKFDIKVSLMDIASNIDLLPLVLETVSFEDILLKSILGSISLGANSLAVIIHRLSENQQEFLNGGSYLLLIYAFIPRLLWSEKPADIALGKWFTDTYWRDWSDVLIAGEGTQGTAFLFPGELYFNFGLIGIPIGMLIIGVIFGYIIKKIYVMRRTMVGFVYLSSVFFTLVYSIFSFASFLAGYVLSLILTSIGLIGCIIIIKIMRFNIWRKVFPRMAKKNRFK